MFSDGTLIFSIVPRCSEKCVTVTLSVVGGFAAAPLWPSDDGCLSMTFASIEEAFGTTDNDAGLIFIRPADGGGDIDGKPFKNGDVGVTARLFFIALDVPARFSVSLSPPFGFCNFVFVSMMSFFFGFEMMTHGQAEQFYKW